jgi:tetratricopeptide (TPR) repeat protein
VPYAQGIVAAARLQYQLGNTAASLNLARRALTVDDSTAGVHNALATIQKQQGDLEGAKKIMNMALYREAPWDKLNKVNNKYFFVGIYEEERRIEQLRILEEAFVGKWGEVIDAAKASKESGEFISWESGEYSALFAVLNGDQV